MFWVMFFVYIIVFRYYVYDLKYLTLKSTYTIRLQNGLLFFPVSLFYAYFAIYYLLPKYILKGRYVSLIAIVLLFTSLLISISYWISTIFDIRLAWDMPLSRASLVRQIDFTVNNGLVFPLTVSGFAIAIKMGKNFYLQQLANEQLAKHKIETQVQLVKSRVHPRFLFHSLNSIYKDMLNGSKQSPEMLLKLSDLLSYILYESDAITPLEKEIALLKSYIDLEKISRANKLTVEIQDETETAGKFIEPLLLLPLAEYIFSTSTDLDDAALLQLNIQTKETVFYFSIAYHSNNINSDIRENIQLAQVEKRLKAQYHGRYDFKLIKDGSCVSLFLSLELETAKDNKAAAVS